MVSESVDRTPVWFGKYKQELLSTNQRIARQQNRENFDFLKEKRGQRLFGEKDFGQLSTKTSSNTSGNEYVFMTPIKHAGKRSLAEVLTKTI